MLQWRGGGRTLAQDPAALREIRYTFEERAAMHEHGGGLDRDEAERLAWVHVAHEWRGVLSSGSTRSRGPTEHWRPPPREMYER